MFDYYFYTCSATVELSIHNGESVPVYDVCHFYQLN